MYGTRAEYRACYGSRDKGGVYPGTITSDVYCPTGGRGYIKQGVDSSPRALLRRIEL